MSENTIITIIFGILLFSIGFLLGKEFNHLKRKEIHHVSNKTEELKTEIHELNSKIRELEKQKDTLKHEKEERLKNWMDSTYKYKIRPIKK